MAHFLATTSYYTCDRPIRTFLRLNASSSVAVSVPKLKIWARTIPGKYPPHTAIAGIEWQPEYSESRIYLYNGSPTKYTDVDLIITSLNQPILKLGQLTQFPNVYIVPAGPADMYEGVFRDANGNKLVPRELTSSSYRIHCAEIISHTTVEIVLATPVLTARPAMQIEGSYQIDNQKYAITNAENFVVPPEEHTVIVQPGIKK